MSEESSVVQTTVSDFMSQYPMRCSCGEQISQEQIDGGGQIGVCLTCQARIEAAITAPPRGDGTITYPVITRRADQ